VCLNAGLVRSQCASGRLYDRPTRSRFPMIFLGPGANYELVPKIHVALYASCATLRNNNFKIFASAQPSRRNQNVVIMLLSKPKTQPKCSASFLCCTLPTVHFPARYLLHFATPYLVSSLLSLEGQVYFRAVNSPPPP
jgi:hypothetical protein